MEAARPVRQEGRKPVRRLLHAGRSGRRWTRVLRAAPLAGLLLCGCTGFWDKVTSRDFEFKTLFAKPNPFVVLRDSTDGDQRAEALRALREPKQNGGTDQDQETVVKILVLG